MKHYVIDTNVLLLDPAFYEHYRGSVVVIPTTVIQELDKHKSSFGALGINARLAARLVLKVAAGLRTGVSLVELPEGNFKLQLPPLSLPVGLSAQVNDDLIIATAFGLSADGFATTVVSNDVNVCSKTLCFFSVFKVDAVQYTPDAAFKITDYYKLQGFDLTEPQQAAFFSGGLAVSAVCGDLFPNQPLLLSGNAARVSKCGQQIHFIEKKKVLCSFKNVRGFKPKNDGQVALVDLIRSADLKILAVCGRTGSGKTLTVLATALELMKSGAYEHIKLYKPVQAMGAELGYLSGDYAEKTAPIKATFESTFEELGEQLQSYEESKRISFDVPVYQRGFTIKNTIIIIDEAQLFEPGVLKGLITRAHESSLVICLGDTKQATDNRFLNENYNGLSNLINRLTGQDFFSVVYLDKSERAEHLNIVDELL